MLGRMAGSKMTEVQILLDDGLEWLSQQPEESVDLIVADPPYNVGKDYGNNIDSKTKEEYVDFTKAWLREAARVLKPSGTIYCFMGFRFISHVYQILEDDLCMKFNSWICWHYTQGLGRKKGFSARHDDILMFNKSDKFKFNLDNVRIPQKFYRSINNMRGANPGDVWEFSHIHYCQANRQKHPTQKPEGLIERMILASSDTGDMVVDPFAGSGTTLRVCQQLKRNCIGVEINEEYVKMTRERLEQPFDGFDSIDLRSKRVPRDLRDPALRDEYVRNHIDWFLSNHEDYVKEFLLEVERMYGGHEPRAHRKRATKKISESSVDLFSETTQDKKKGAGGK